MQQMQVFTPITTESELREAVDAGARVQFTSMPDPYSSPLDDTEPNGWVDSCDPMVWATEFRPDGHYFKNFRDGKYRMRAIYPDEAEVAP